MQLKRVSVLVCYSDYVFEMPRHPLVTQDFFYKVSKPKQR